MHEELLIVHGPSAPAQPLVLDSPHSGRGRPADFGSMLDDTALQTAEDSFVDALYLPAT
ncbi:MAG: N-formylglutamate amidohydrolase, partial [Burkholderiaceae bacterium]